MKRFRSLWAVALIALLLSALAPQAQAVWQCEGRTCATTPWYCCCESPVEAQDDNCRSSTRPAASAACATDCGCVLSVRASHALWRSMPQGFVMPVSHPALLPGLPVTVAPPLTGMLARSLETRAPLLPCRPWNIPSLRAPPAA